MLHEYLTGQRPGFGPAFSSPAEAVSAGQQVSPSPLVHPEMRRLVLALTDAHPHRRPRIEAFLDAVDDESVLEFPSSVTDRRGSRVKINMGPGSTTSPAGGIPAPRPGTSPPSAPSTGGDTGTRPSRVRIRLDARPVPRPPEESTRPPE